MIFRTAPVLCVPLVAFLSACSGGSGGLLTLADYNALGADPNLASFTPDATVDARSGTATYTGITNLVIGGAVEKGYLGDLSATVNFTNDTVSGTANNFSMYFSAVADPKNGQSVGGSLTLNGILTGDNETMTKGILGTATGAVDGTNLNMEMEGNITGLNSEGMMLWLNDDVANAIGGGFLLR